MQVKTNPWVCAQNYSGAQFIAPTRGPILGPSLVPSPTGDWGDKIRVFVGFHTRVSKYYIDYGISMDFP